MNLSYPKEYESFRREVEAFLADQHPRVGEETVLPLSERPQGFRERANFAGSAHSARRDRGDGQGDHGLVSERMTWTSAALEAGVRFAGLRTEPAVGT